MSYASAAQLPRSEKVLLATVDAREVVKLFTLDTGSQYYRDVSHYVVGVLQNGVPLTAGSLPLSAGQYHFAPTTGRLSVRMTDSANPSTHRVTITYRMFYSTSGHSLPMDLASGTHVNWDGRITASGEIVQELDDENVGVVVESTSSLTLINEDGHFDTTFDALIWENRDVTMWSWITSTPVSQAQKLFSGIVTEKSFTSSSVVFRLRDFTFRLRDKMALPLYSEEDGYLDESQIGKPKRRLIGRFKQAQCVGVDKILKGYPLDVTASGAADATSITFSGSILGKVFVGDKITVPLRNGETDDFTVDAIVDATTVTVSDEIETPFNGVAATTEPENGDRRANRRWLLAGHEIHQPTYTISAVVDARRITLSSVAGIHAGDALDVDGVMRFVRRVSENTVTLTQELSPLPSVSDPVTRYAVGAVYVNGTRYIQGRDFELENTDEAVIVFDPLAEFNVASSRSIADTDFTFTSGSRVVTSDNAELDLRTILSPRDWIRVDDPALPTFYEIAYVGQNDLELTAAYAGSTDTEAALYKKPELIQDDAIVTVDCYGLQDAGGAWVKTAADAVEYILEVDAGLTNINTASFTKANATCDYVMSLLYPESLGGDTPEIRAALSQINESVYGSLYTNAAFQLEYAILNSSRPTDLTALRDDDILGFSVTSKNQICDSVRCFYRPFTDKITGEDTTEQIEETSPFVAQTSDIERLEEKTVYLYEEAKAKIVAQRFLLFRALPNSRVKVQTKLNLATKSLNDKLYLELDRLYSRFGGRDRRKVGIIASIRKTGTSVDVEFNDLGNAFNRVGCIAPNAQSVYASATRDDVARCAFIVDNTVETPSASSETDLGLNLIG